MARYSVPPSSNVRMTDNHDIRVCLLIQSSTQSSIFDSLKKLRNLIFVVLILRSMPNLIISKCLLLAILAEKVASFSIVSTHKVLHPHTFVRDASALFSTSEPSEEEIQDLVENSKMSSDDVEMVANLAADDEWLGLSMELSELVRVAVIEETKKNTRDFIGKDEYKVSANDKKHFFTLSLFLIRH